MPVALLEYPYHTINHNLRLYILSFLPYTNRDFGPCGCEQKHDTGGCPKKHYGYFLSDPTRTIYRTSYMHSFYNINDSDFLNSGAFYSGTKSITIHVDLDSLPNVEQKVRRFIRRMHRQTIILCVHTPMSVKSTDQLVNIANQQWPKNVVFGVLYDYTDDEYDELTEEEHRVLFEHLRGVVVHPRIKKVHLSFFSICAEKPFKLVHYYNLLENIPKKCRKMFICTDSYISINTQEYSNQHIQLLEQPRFWELAAPTFCAYSFDSRTYACLPEVMNAFLEHGFPRLNRLPKQIACGLLKEIANRPHLHQYLPKELDVDNQYDNRVDLCELVDILAKIKIDKLTLPWSWTISDWSLFEQKIQQVFEVWGPETPIHIESGRMQYFYPTGVVKERLCLRPIKCDLVNLPVALSREIAVSLCDKKKQ